MKKSNVNIPPEDSGFEIYPKIESETFPKGPMVEILCQISKNTLSFQDKTKKN